MVKNGCSRFHPTQVHSAQPICTQTADKEQTNPSTKRYSERGHGNSLILTAKHSQLNYNHNRHNKATFSRTCYRAGHIPTPSQRGVLPAMGAMPWNRTYQAPPPTTRLHLHYYRGHETIGVRRIINRTVDANIAESGPHCRFHTIIYHNQC